jgi:hypothetical protein
MGLVSPRADYGPRAVSSLGTFAMALQLIRGVSFIRIFISSLRYYYIPPYYYTSA